MIRRLIQSYCSSRRQAAPFIRVGRSRGETGRKFALAIFAAFTLLGSIATSFAQVPAPVPALPDAERRTSYSITASQCLCTVNFALFGDTNDYQNWIEVWLNGQMANYNDPALGWTITSPTGPLSSIARPITDGVLTFNLPQTGTVQIVGARRPRRVSQFFESTGVPARNVNQVVTDIIAKLREVWDKINDVTGRVPRAPPGETLAMLPPAASRANMGVCFDSNGNMVPCVGSSAGSFAAGNGVTFTGTNPTTIATNFAAGTGIALSGTGPITISSKVLNSSIAGASTTFTQAQNNTLVSRSNSGAAMSDTLPGTSPGVLAASTIVTVSNIGATAIMSIGVGSGAGLKTATASTGFVYLCPGQSATFYSDGANYWQTGAPGKCRITTATTIFASVSGSGNGNGLTAANSIAGIQAIWNFSIATFDLGGFNFTMQLADGTYNTTTGNYLMSPFTGQINVGDFAPPCCATFNKSTNVILQGNNTTPDNVVIANTNPGNNQLGTMFVSNGAAVFITGLKLVGGAQGAYDIFIGAGGFAQLTNVDFGTCLEGQVSVFPGGTAFLSPPYTISGSCDAHVIAGGQGAFIAFLTISGVVTITNTPTFVSGFAVAQSGQIDALTAGVTFSGSLGAGTSPRYSSFGNGVIEVGTSSCGSGTFFPGNSNGTCQTGGQYQ